MIREAILYEKLTDSRVQCNVCAHRCKISPDRSGACGVRENRDGVLYSLVYGTMIAEHIDPIEKKPFFHVYPGSKSYSIATVGCNFRCAFCQNADISQMPRSTRMIMGEDKAPLSIVEKAEANNCTTIAYTYTEPTVYLETALDTSVIATRRNIKNVFVTNGYMTRETIDVLKPYLSAANVDLKSFRDDFYKKYCGGSLKPVLDSLTAMKELGIWLEITTLLIPGLNDSEPELKEIAGFIAGLGREIPWHISRFYPQYHMLDRDATSVNKLHFACRIGKDAGLKYVYCGNVPGDQGENTLCANCSKILVKRYGYKIMDNAISGTSCSFCGQMIEGLF